MTFRSRCGRATALAVGLAALLSAAPAKARTVVLLPLGGSVIAEGGGLVLGFCDDPGRTEVEVTLNGRAHVVELWDGVFDIDLDWAVGDNQVTVGDQKVSFRHDAYADAPRSPSVHQAMADNCANCHVLGPERSLALRADGDGLCRGCHSTVAGSFAHRGAACASCHAPHTSWQPRLLKAQGNAACVACHAAQADEKETSHGGVWRLASCSICHRAHSPRPDGAGAACASCHADVASVVPAHAAAVTPSCPNCHLMHREVEQPQAKLPAESCATCHADSQDARHQKASADCGACHGEHRPREKGSLEPVCRACHEPVFAKKRRHGPDAVGDCGVCHLVHDVKNRSPAIFSCTQCHGPEKLEGGHTGAVVAFNSCVLCHRLHESDEPGFLPREQHTVFRQRRCADCHARPGVFGGDRKIAGSWAPLCRTCHPDDDLGRLSHDPAAEGDCQACHDPHASAWKGQLRQEPRPLCGTCHGEIVAAFGGRHGALGCPECHAPHGNENDHHLRRPGNDLCTMCHRDPTLDVGGVARETVHGPLNTAGCAICHDPHGGVGKHLRKRQGDLCADCHEAVARPEAAKTGGRLHAPVARGECAACHEPHASRGRALLKSDGNALCTRCHDLTRHSHTLSPRAASSVAIPPGWPRDGNRFSCTGCHRPHSSPIPRLLTDPRAVLCKRCHKGV